MAVLKTPHLIVAALPAAMALLVPIAVGASLIGNRVMFNFFAADSMYYHASSPDELARRNRIVLPGSFLKLNW